MFAPTQDIDDKVPAWLSQIPTGLVKDIYDQMARRSNINMINKAGVPLDPLILLAITATAMLTKGVTIIRDGDFAFSSHVSMDKIVQSEGFSGKSLY